MLKICGSGAQGLALVGLTLEILKVAAFFGKKRGCFAELKVCLVDERLLRLKLGFERGFSGGDEVGNSCRSKSV